MGFEHLYGRIITATLGALLCVCAFLAGAKFIRSRAKVLSLQMKARGVVFAALMGVVTATAIVASMKPGSASPNMVGRAALSAPQRLANGTPLRRRGDAPPYQITDVDVSNGWRVAETREGCEIVERDAFDAPQMYAPWLARGGYKDKTRIAPYGWSFPWRDGILDGITVFSEGKLRVNVHTNYFPMPFDVPLAVVPSFNWNLLPGGVSNVFWHAVSPSNSLVVTWENSPVNRDVNSLTNFQAELFADGSFEYRYDDHTIAYSRVHPLDLDFDGLPNTIDPEPETPLGAPVWNQSDAWAAAAFPSNATEIASAGGYAAWAMQRASDPNRRLVRLNVALQGGRWPVCVDVGIVPVMADGSSDLLYAIDCGAQVPFSLSDGELASVLVRRTIPPSDFQTFIQSDFQTSSFPHEWSVGDVTVHLDDPQAGWMRRTADVDVDDSELTHLHPGESVHLTAVVTNCHADAYLGCAWHGGKGISFSNPHSLATTLTYASSSTVQWATNNAYLVTSYAGGYSLTNTIWFTVGIEEEPTPCFTLGCQKVFFLNDADFLNDGPCPTNRPERIRPVTLNLLGPYGTNGTVKLSAQGSASPVMFYIDNGVTNRITESTEIPLEVTDPFARTGTNTFYVSCPKKGTGTISATLTLDGGATLTDTASFKCIEPLRKLVTTEKIDGRFINPSRLVMGTNAVLQVGVNGDFDATNVHWHVVSGSADISPSNGFTTTVVPTGANDDVVIEARFNDDEIQPRFVLPVVHPRIIPVKAFVAVRPSGEPAITLDDIQKQIDVANIIFSQVGVAFGLQGQPERIQGTNAWDLTMYETTELLIGDDDLSYDEYTREFMEVIKPNQPVECLEIYYVGSFKYSEKRHIGHFALCLSQKIIMPFDMSDQVLAHEFGHSFGLKDIYVNNRYGIEGEKINWIELDNKDKPVSYNSFRKKSRDWGAETGRGFYGKDDTMENVIKRVLMYGIEDGDDIFGDIPDEQLWGLPDHAHTQENAALIWVGAKLIDQ